MKKIILLLFLVPLQILSQNSIGFDNSLSGIYSQSKSGNQLQINFQGNNSCTFKKISYESQTNWAVGFNPTLSNNELIQRTNVGKSFDKVDVFATHQFNYSLSREISSDNWAGIGIGLKKVKDWGKMSISYATIFQNTMYFTDQPTSVFRHSIRGKIKCENKTFGITCEYFYQPSVEDFQDYIVYGSTKITLFPKNPLNFVIQDMVNYRSLSSVNLIHNFTFGLSYKFSKNF